MSQARIKVLAIGSACALAMLSRTPTTRATASQCNLPRSSSLEHSRTAAASRTSSARARCALS
jgi:hypothetical protein